MTNPTDTATGTDVLIAADGSEIVGTYYPEPALFRANGDGPADGLFVVHYSDVDGRLLLRRDIYPLDVLATLNPRTTVPAWTEAVANAREIQAIEDDREARDLYREGTWVG